MSFSIIGTGSAFPNLNLTNDDLKQHLDTDDEWIFPRTGIKSRYIATTESLVDIATAAAKEALEDAKIKPDELDLIILSTIGGDYCIPAHACMVQKGLGATCPAFDLNAACTGFVYALDVAAAYLDSKKAKNILIVSAELMSSYIDWRDRSTCILFGDGAGAAVLTRGDSLLGIRLSAKGDDELLTVGGAIGNSPYINRQTKSPYLNMVGPEIFKFAVNSMCDDLTFLLNECGLVLTDLKKIIPHQANYRIINAARQRLGDTDNRLVCDIAEYGNTSSASIPITLSKMFRTGEIEKGDIIALSAYGGGLTTGACIIKI